MAQPLGGFVDARGAEGYDGTMEEAVVWGLAVVAAIIWVLVTEAGELFRDAIERDHAEASARALERERNDPVPRTDLDRLLRRQLP